MTDDSATLSPGAVPAACTFFRSVFDDPDLSDHDLALVLDHAATCVGCTNEIGRRINDETSQFEGHSG